MRNENGFSIQMGYDRVRLELIIKHKDYICILKYPQFFIARQEI